jgi:nucleoside-diphosphate-sugar epimerase
MGGGKPFTIRMDKTRRELGYAPRISWKGGLAAMTAPPSRA